MESMREVNRVMEREIKKGSTPLAFEQLGFGDYSYNEITSKEKLEQVLSYLLRIGDYKQYVEKTIMNNVYMDLKGKKAVFKRTRLAYERNNIFVAIKRFAKKCKPDFEGKVYLETVRCFFSISDENLEKCRYTYEDKNTYAFVMSDKYIIPSIGINIHTKGTEHFEDVEMDIVSGKVADLEMLEYVPDISDNPKAVEVIGELIDKLPDIEVRGSLEKFQTAILAAQIDQLSYDYDTYQYRDTVDDRDAQIATITEDIRSGNTEYLHDFLNAIVSDGIREAIVDMFGKGMDTDNSEAIQTVRKAQELLDKLSAYKPLAKVEELEEGNYNMVDNVLNNGVEKKEQERMAGRISIREKLAEKKAAIEHKDKTVQKDQDRKTQREM